ncbi:MAG: ABC transporter ATP-binding protein [Chloroflexi bacterium]|nr:ABC transporter ATP-binding protein [Chloroflexota bacterium]
MSTLELHGIEASYPGRPTAQPVLRGIDLRLEPGEMLALIGPNGAGKSTLLRLAGGLLRPSAGRALLLDKDLRTLRPREVAREVAVVPQEGPIPAGLIVREMVALGRTPYARLLLGPRPHDRETVQWALAAAGVNGLADRFIDEISGGERQRVILARALAQEPRLLLLDEPTANLDLHHQVAMLELVRGLTRERGIAVLAAVHDLQLAALYCDRVALMQAGRIVSQGPPEAVLTEPLLLQAFGQRVILSEHPTHGVPLIALVPNGNARRLPVADERNFEVSA